MSAERNMIRDDAQKYIRCMCYAMDDSTGLDAYKEELFRNLHAFCKKFTSSEILTMFENMDNDYGFQTIFGTLSAEEYLFGILDEKSRLSEDTIVNGRVKKFIYKMSSIYAAEIIALRIANASEHLKVISALIAGTPDIIMKDTVMGVSTYEFTYKDIAPLLGIKRKHDLIHLRYEYTDLGYEPLDLRNEDGTFYKNKAFLSSCDGAPYKPAIMNALFPEIEVKDICEKPAPRLKEIKDIELPGEIEEKLGFIRRYIKSHPIEERKLNKLNIFYIPEYKKICETIKAFNGYPGKENLLAYKTALNQKEEFAKKFDEYLNQVAEDLFSEELLEQDADLKVAQQFNNKRLF